MKKILPIILILLLSLSSCIRCKCDRVHVNEVISDTPEPPTTEERMENADYTVIAGDWVYIFSDGSFEYVEDSEAASFYTTSEKIYDATEFSGEDAVYNFAAAILAKKPSALAYESVDGVKYSVFDGEYFYYIAGDMTTYNLDIQSSGHISDKTFTKWDFGVEVSRPDECVILCSSIGSLSAEKGTELGFVTSGRLASVREENTSVHP